MKKLLPVFLTAALFLTTFAQTLTIPVWKGKIPGSINNPLYFEDTLHLDNHQIRVYRVTDPTLTIYEASKEIATGTAIIIAPGGGYTRLAMDNEGSATAKWLNNLGITAIVLKYRLPNDSIMEKKEFGPLQDAQEAIRVVRRMAGDLRLDPHKIGIMGFSAGGHLAASLSTHYNDVVYPADTTSARPDLAVLGYPVITMEAKISHSGSRQRLLGTKPDETMISYFSCEKNVTKDTPPTLVFQASDDQSVSVMNSILYYEALRKSNVPCELHLFQSGGHGFGMGKGGTESGWTDICKRWLVARGFIPKIK